MTILGAANRVGDGPLPGLHHSGHPQRALLYLPILAGIRDQKVSGRKQKLAMVINIAL
jgi:hypothetical protein